MTLEEFKEYKNRPKCFYTKEEIQEILNDISQKVVVDTLPTEGQENYLYLVPSIVNPGTYEQYTWKNNDWEYFGNVDETQYTDYVTNPEMDLAFDNLKTINNKSLLGGGNLTILEEELPNKTHDPSNFSGLGRKYLQKNIVSGKNVLTQAMMSDANTIYVIQYDFTLGENITVPANCVLEFEGGSISGEHTLTGVNTGIVAQGVTIFNTDVVLDGTWNLSKLDIRWFGAKDAGNFTVENNTVSGAFDSSNAIQAALNCSATGYDSVYIPSGRFYITKTLYNRRQKNIEFEGHSNDAPLLTYKTNPSQCGVIFTDKDIDVLVIDKEINYSWKRGLYIKGGCIDTSICIPYTHSNTFYR